MLINVLPTLSNKTEKLSPTPLTPLEVSMKKLHPVNLWVVVKVCAENVATVDDTGKYKTVVPIYVFLYRRKPNFPLIIFHFYMMMQMVLLKGFIHILCPFSK